MALVLPSISLDENGNLQIGAGNEIVTNFSEIKNRVNPLFTDVLNLQTFWDESFETLSAFTLNFASSPSLPGGGTSGPYPTGTYLKSSAVQPFTIDLIEDSDLFVKMTLQERSFIESIIDTNISSFKMKVGDNSAINETIKLISGQMITLSQLYVDNEIQVKIDAAIPIEYFRTSTYSVTPTKPDPSNLYRYKVSTSAYVSGTLRVYVNTHRIPNDLIDQSLSSIGEFYFINTLPLSELPSGRDDIIYCDFENPVIVSPLEASANDSTLAKWWGDIYTASDGSVVQPTSELQPLRFYALSGDYSASSGYNINEDIFRIVSDNPYADKTGSIDNGMETVFFILDTIKIDHNKLKNWTFDAHHPVGYDNQNIWYKIIGTDASEVIPNSTQTNLTFTSGDASVAAVISGSTINLTATAVNYFTRAAGIISPTTTTDDFAIASGERFYFDGGTDTYVIYDDGLKMYEFFIDNNSVGRMGA